MSFVSLFEDIIQKRDELEHLFALRDTNDAQLNQWYQRFKEVVAELTRLLELATHPDMNLAYEIECLKNTVKTNNEEVQRLESRIVTLTKENEKLEQRRKNENSMRRAAERELDNERKARKDEEYMAAKFRKPR